MWNARADHPGTHATTRLQAGNTHPTPAESGAARLLGAIFAVCLLTHIPDKEETGIMPVSVPNAAAVVTIPMHGGCALPARLTVRKAFPLSMPLPSPPAACKGFPIIDCRHHVR